MKKLLLSTVAALSIGAVLLLATPREGFTMDPPAAMPVSVASALQKDITRWAEFSGRLRAVEDVEVRPRVAGIIDAVHFREGDLVKKGDPLFTIDMRPFQAALAQAEAELASAQARASLAGSTSARAQKLFKQKALSQREYDERINANKEAQAAIKAAEAALTLAKLNVEYAEVRAPISGRVGRPDITVGNTVAPGMQVLTTIQSVDPVYADFDIDEQTYLRAMKSVRAGRASDMPVFMALADEQEFKREGKIRSFDNQLQGDSGTMRVRAEFPNTDGILTPGLFARIRLGTADKTSAVLVNDAAINTDQDRKFVYAVDDKGMVNYRPVQLGVLENGLRVIETGLQPGEKIVVNGLMRVRPGVQVQPVIVSMETLKPEGAPAGDTTAAPAGEKPADAPPATDPNEPPSEAPQEGK
ncbi:MAG TPA: efflux RND transporter periplasmic adaptor subunit [Patescibacteria group bacterium]|nr:efflux RND transporter periplasmic adaptor subunit [Patescibacteria group bacterium]